MRYRIIRYMTGYAIQRRDLWWWEFVRHGDYWPSHLMEEDNKVIKFDTQDHAKAWLAETLFIKDCSV